MKDADFFMRLVEGSHDTRIFDCKAGLRVRNPIRDDLLVITADPPLPIGPEDATEATAILATRYRGATLFPPGVWPIDVYVISVRAGVEFSPHHVLQPTEFVLAMWGVLFPTFEQAALSIEMG